MPVGSRFSAPVQTGPGAYPDSCKMGSGSFPGVKRSGRGVDHPPRGIPLLPFQGALYLYSYCAPGKCPAACGTASQRNFDPRQRRTSGCRNSCRKTASRPCWKPNSCSANQQVPCIIRYPHVHCRANKSPPLVPIRSLMNPAHTVSPYFF